MSGRARAGYEALTPFGRLLASTVPVVLLLSAALVGMVCRGSDVPATPVVGVAVEGAPLQSLAPILPPADLVQLLRGVDEARAEAGEGGAGSSALALSVASPAEAFAEALAVSPWPRALWPQVTAIAECESRFGPHRVGDGGLSFGAMQVHAPAWPRLARAFDLLDLRENLAAAYVAYLESGRSFAPWTCWDGGE